MHQAAGVLSAQVEIGVALAGIGLHPYTVCTPANEFVRDIVNRQPLLS